MESIKSNISQVDILDVIQRYVPLKRRGLNHIGLCPFHAEKTPSFNVNSKRGKWKCFGCGKGGDVVDFIQLHDNKSFSEALEVINLKGLPMSSKMDFKPLPPPKKLSVLPPELVNASMQFYTQNNFIIGLYKMFEKSIVDKVIKTFCVGTSKLWEGATAFWYIDQRTQVRQVKLMLYNSETLKRIKKEQAPNIGKPKALFFGSTLLKKRGVKEPHLSACWFGENQLSENSSKTVAIVESEKTAIIMTIFGWMNYPLASNYIWVATGGASAGQWNNLETLKALEGRDVVLFPDLDAHDRWVELSWNLIDCNSVKVSPLLLKHKKPNEKDKRDIADFFLSTYKNAPLDLEPSKTNLAGPEPQKTVEQDLSNDTNSYPSDWDEPVLIVEEKEKFIIEVNNETTTDDLKINTRSENRISIKEIEKYERLQELRKKLENVDYPEQPVILSDGCTKIYDICKFIVSHISFIKHNNRGGIEPYFLRLENLSIILSNMEKRPLNSDLRTKTTPITTPK